MRRIAALIFAVLAIALVAAGCGGGGSSTGGGSTADAGSSSESSEGGGGESGAESEDEEGAEEEEEGSAAAGGAAPTKAAFVKEADKVCSDADLKLSEEVIAFAKEKGIDIEHEEEPSDDQQTEIYEQIVLPNIAKQAEELEALTPPAGDEEKVEDITSTLSREVEEAEGHPDSLDESTLEEASEKAQDYGLKTCGG
jgi:hypothetical protein